MVHALSHTTCLTLPSCAHKIYPKSYLKISQILYNFACFYVYFIAKGNKSKYPHKELYTMFETLSTLFTLPTLHRLGLGLWVSFSIAFVSIALSIALGSVVGLAMMSRFYLVRLAMKCYLESMRIIPVLALLYVLYFGLPQMLNVSITNYAVAIVAVRGLLR